MLLDAPHREARDDAADDSDSERQPPFSIPLEQLEDEITTLCAHLGAAEHRLLTAIGELDARSGWAGIGIASCAHWLSWKCGISLPAAHERVRIARALRGLPEISAAMSLGQLSYSKVRAITRVATRANESALVRLARQGTASHIEEIVRRYRRVSQLDDAANAAHSTRSREVRYRWDEDGTFVLHARLPPEQGALVLKKASRWNAPKPTRWFSVHRTVAESRTSRFSAY